MTNKANSLTSTNTPAWVWRGRAGWSHKEDIPRHPRPYIPAGGLEPCGFHPALDRRANWGRCMRKSRCEIRIGGVIGGWWYRDERQVACFFYNR